MANFIVVESPSLAEPFYINTECIFVITTDYANGLVRIYNQAQPATPLVLNITNSEFVVSSEATEKGFNAIVQAISARPGGPFVPVLFPDDVICDAIEF